MVAYTTGLLTATYGAVELNGRDNTSPEANHFITIEVGDGATVSLEQAGLVGVVAIGGALAVRAAFRIIDSWR